MKDSEEKTRLRLVLRAAIWPIRLLLVAIGVYAIRAILVLPDAAARVADGIIGVLTTLAVVFFIYRLLDVLVHEVSKLAEKEESLIEDSFVQLTRILGRVLIMGTGAIYILKALSGKPMSTLLAGLGIGGVAVALAAPAGAHDLWLLAEEQPVPADAPLRLKAATGMRFPESLSAVTPDRVAGFWVVDAAGKRHEVGRARAEGKMLRASARVDAPGVALAALAIKPRTLELSADDFNEYLEHDGLPQILERRRAR